VHTRKPEEVPWGALGVDYLAEASGVFLTAEGAEPHVKVIVCVLCVCVCVQDASLHQCLYVSTNVIVRVDELVLMWHLHMVARQHNSCDNCVQ
jgi:hypothetical protein